MNKKYPDYKKIYLFCSIIKKYSPTDFNTFMDLFNMEMVGFSQIFDFFQDIGLVKMNGKNKFTIKSKLKKNLGMLQGVYSYNIPNKHFIINCILDKKNSITYSDLNTFLNTFHYSKSNLILKKSAARSKVTKEFLVLLLELQFIELREGNYIVSKDIFDISSYIRNRTGISQYTLNEILRNKNKLGMLAEKEILIYEIKRLSNLGYEESDIKIVGRKDVTCGYDIKSYTIKNDELINIYIEVKAVSLKDYKFYWSRNEKDAARNLKDKYYLYLLPTEGNRSFDISSLKILQNPISYFSRNKKWEIRNELESYFLK